jgi:hypothetical protein
LQNRATIECYKQNIKTKMFQRILNCALDLKNQE